MNQDLLRAHYEDEMKTQIYNLLTKDLTDLSLLPAVRAYMNKLDTMDIEQIRDEIEDLDESFRLFRLHRD